MANDLRRPPKRGDAALHQFLFIVSSESYTAEIRLVK